MLGCSCATQSIVVDELPTLLRHVSKKIGCTRCSASAVRATRVCVCVCVCVSEPTKMVALRLPAIIIICGDLR